MGWIKGLVKRGADVAQSVGKVPMKSLDSPVIKTTSQVLGDMRKSIAGGVSRLKAPAKDAAKGAGSLARVGGKTFAATGIVGVPLLAASRVYGSVATEWAKTSDLRQYEAALDLSERESNIRAAAQERELDYARQAQILAAQQAGEGTKTGDPYASASDGWGGFYPNSGKLFGDKSADVAMTESKTSATKAGVIGAVLIAGLLAGAYVYKKK